MITKDDYVKYHGLTVGQEYTLETLICNSKAKTTDGSVITEDDFYYREGEDTVLSEQRTTFKPDTEDDGVVRVQVEIPEGIPSVTVYHRLLSESDEVIPMESYTLESETYEKLSTVTAESGHNHMINNIQNSVFGISALVLIVICIYLFRQKSKKRG